VIVLETTKRNYKRIKTINGRVYVLGDTETTKRNYKPYPGLGLQRVAHDVSRNN